MGHLGVAGIVLVVGLDVTAAAVWEFELSLDEHIRFLRVQSALEEHLIVVPALGGGNIMGLNFPARALRRGPPLAVASSARSGIFQEASSFLAVAKASSSSSTLSRRTRSTHLSAPVSRCNLARNSARAARSPGIDREAGLDFLTRMGASQADSSSAWAITSRSIAS